MRVEFFSVNSPRRFKAPVPLVRVERVAWTFWLAERSISAAPGVASSWLLASPEPDASSLSTDCPFAFWFACLARLEAERKWTAATWAALLCMANSFSVNKDRILYAGAFCCWDILDLARSAGVDRPS